MITIHNLSKSFFVGNQNVPILKNISFTVNKGDFLIIFGPSGCGKSTLLHTILGLEEPTSGEVNLLDQNLYSKNSTEDSRADIRKKHIGMVYQQPNWIKSLNVIENIAFPLQLIGVDKKSATPKAKEMLRQIEMEDWANYLPSQLSSGQQQKIALARAIISDPEFIIADEPTGNLDFESGKEIMQLLTKLNQFSQKTILMVTHDLEYLTYAKTAIKMFDGAIVDQFGLKDKDKLSAEIKSKRGSN